MGLGFTIHTKIKETESFHQDVDNYAVGSVYNAGHDGLSSVVGTRKLGNLFLNHQHEGERNTDDITSVNKDCQISMLAPSFHIIVIEFIGKLRQATGSESENVVKWMQEDRTNIYPSKMNIYCMGG